MRKVTVAIIGSSVSGSSLALRLGRAGIKTLLIDKVEFPRRKACGEGLSILGLQEITELGLDAAVLSKPHVPFYGFRFHENGKTSTVQVSPNGTPHGIGISRLHLDNEIINQARGLAAVDVRLGTTPSITRAGEGFRIDLGSESIEASYLVLATGGLSNLPESLGVSAFRTGYARCGVRVDVRPTKLPFPSEPALVSIVLGDSYEVCCTNTAESVNFSFMTKRKSSAVLRRKNIFDLLPRIQEITGIEGGISEEPIGVGRIGSLTRPSRTGRIFVVGDALRQLDPIGGMGMTHAFISARVTAETLIAEILGMQAMHRGMSHEARLRRELSRLTAYTNLSYLSLSTPVGRRTLGRLKTGFVSKDILSSMHGPAAAASRFAALTLSLLSTWSGL